MVKATNVDLFKELGLLVDKYTDHYKTDLDIDKKTLIDAVSNKSNPAAQPMIWLCRASGTWLYPESEVFIQNSSANTTICYYAEKECGEVRAARIVEPQEQIGDTVYGNIYEVDYLTFVDKVKREAVPAKYDHFEFEDSFVYDAAFNEKGYAVFPRYLTDEHGKVVYHKTIPSDPERHTDLINQNKQEREKYKERVEAILPFTNAEYQKYLQLKQEHPESIICFGQNRYYELYGSDAEKTAEIIGAKLLKKKINGKEHVSVTGFLTSLWVATAKKLCEHGFNVFLFKDGEIVKDFHYYDFV